MKMLWSTSTTTFGIASWMIILAANSSHAFLMTTPQLYRHMNRGVARGIETCSAIGNAGYCSRRNEPRIHTLLLNSKWENLVDDDDDDEESQSAYNYNNIPPDMKYIPRNVVRQHTNFCDIREAGGVQMTNDVYVRDPNSNIFWFVGKVARVSDVTVAQCVGRQYDLIVQHAKQLRPLELSSCKFGTLELWTAPGDSELQVAYNKPDLIMEKMERPDDAAAITAAINKNYVGFQGEIYQQGEDGFRTWRTDDGRAAKPEITPAAPTSNTSASDQGEASQEEIDRLLKVMDGMDVNELYKQQEKREGREVED